MAYREVYQSGDTGKSSGAGRLGKDTAGSHQAPACPRNTVRKYLTAAKADGIARDGPVSH